MRYNFSFLIKFKILFLLVFTFFCSKPEFRNACDPKSDSFKSFLALRGILGSSFSFCTFRSNSSGNSKLVSTNFSDLSNQAPVVVSKSQVLGFTFTDEMEITGCGLKFQSPVNPQISFSISATATSSTEGRTLFMTPNTSWPTDIYNGFNLELLPSCKSKNGNTVTTDLGFKIYISDVLVYLDSKGSDTNQGTDVSPVASFSKAISLASSNCNSSLSCVVAVKSGEYTISSPIIITPSTNSNLSIFGGFESTDWKKRRADKTMLTNFDTILTDSSSNVIDNTSSDPYMPLKYLGTTGSFEKNIIDGLTINGPSSGATGESLAVLGIVNLQAGAGVVIRNTITKDRATGNSNVTSAGFMSGNNSGKIELTNNSFSGSTLTAGTTSGRYGIVYFGSGASSELSISKSILEGGVTTTSASGLFTSSSINGTINITENTITAPSCTGSCTGTESAGILGPMPTSTTISFNTISGSSSSGPSRGISISSGTATITENTITSGIGQNTSGISATTSGTLTITKNKITSLEGVSQNSAAISIAGTVSMVANDNIITSGNTTVAGAHSFGINLNSTGASTISNNTITTGTSNSTTSHSAGVHINNTGTVTFTNNKITSGSAGGDHKFGSSGIIINSNANITLNSNTITSGNCILTNCVSAAIFQTSTATSIGTNNTLTGGNCTGGSCSTIGYYIAGIDTLGGLLGTNTQNSIINLTSNSIKGGDCSSTNCRSSGFSTKGSDGTIYTFTNNTKIEGGNSVAGSGGIDMVSNSSTHTYSGNTISSGSCSGVSCQTFGLNLAFGTNFTLTNNTISTGTCTGTACKQTGLRHAANGSLLVIEGNTVDSGTPTTNSEPIALSLENWPNTPTTSIQRNTFISRDGAYANSKTVLTTAQNKQMKFCSNVIMGGTKTNGGTVTALDVDTNSGGAIFMGNTIIPTAMTGGGTSNGFRFISSSAYTGLKLDQNIIYGNPATAANTTCVLENGAGVTFATFEKNNLNNCATFYSENGAARNSWCSGTFHASPCVTPISAPAATSNIDPAFIPIFTNFASNNFRVTAPTQITTAMVTADITVFNTSCGNSLDRDGQTRTNGSSIGAYK
jgi:hypothetical protein